MLAIKGNVFCFLLCLDKDGLCTSVVSAPYTFQMVGSVCLFLEWDQEACARFLKFLVEVEVIDKYHNPISHTFFIEN